MTSYDGLVYYLIFHNGVFYNNIIHIATSVFYNNIIHITTSECILYNNAVRPVICEGWHFTHTIVYKPIVRRHSEAMVNFEPKSDHQHQLLCRTKTFNDFVNLRL
jgi:hypothetical protein